MQQPRQQSQSSPADEESFTSLTLAHNDRLYLHRAHVMSLISAHERNTLGACVSRQIQEVHRKLRGVNPGCTAHGEEEEEEVDRCRESVKDEVRKRLFEELQELQLSATHLVAVDAVYKRLWAELDEARDGEAMVLARKAWGEVVGERGRGVGWDVWMRNRHGVDVDAF